MKAVSGNRMARRNKLDDRYAINAAKTELREGYKNADVERILSVYADAFTDMSDGQPSFLAPTQSSCCGPSWKSFFANIRWSGCPSSSTSRLLKRSRSSMDGTS